MLVLILVTTMTLNVRNFVGLVLHINFGEIEEAFWCRAFKALPGFRPENVKTPEMTHIAFKEKRDFISFV